MEQLLVNKGVNERNLFIAQKKTSAGRKLDRMSKFKLKVYQRAMERSILGLKRVNKVRIVTIGLPFLLMRFPLFLRTLYNYNKHKV